jgi:alkylhydroperoxidase/carboxymuconolactone decarboxylase family protein YurZ
VSIDGDELARRMIQQRGGREEPSWTWIAKVDPEFMAAFNTIAQRVFGYNGDASPDTGALPAKVKELIAVALLAGQRDWDRLPSHISRVMVLGASDREILESLETSAAITGGPAMRMGVEVLLRLKAEAQDQLAVEDENHDRHPPS